MHHRNLLQQSQSGAADMLPEPPTELKQHSQDLQQLLLNQIEQQGPLSFAEYMQQALYAPGLGYYSAGLQKFGPGGDFITAPELGQLFGHCLANQAQQILDQGGYRHILELGAGSGSLAASLVAACAEQLETYWILETSATLRASQRAYLENTIPQLVKKVRWLDTPPTSDWEGLLLANEVLDALPVERFKVDRSGIEQACVDQQEGQLINAWRPASKPLVQAVETIQNDLGTQLADGYTSEVNLLLQPWLSALTKQLRCGVVLLIDYGYNRAEYYHPQRDQGSLVCHYRHRGHSDALFWPGLQDITAFVDFSAVAEAGAHNDLGLAGYCTQAMFLLGCGLDQQLTRLASDHSRAAIELSAEAKRLTLPDEMGEKFQAIALQRQHPHELTGFQLQDLRHRL